ncbi:MAG: dihydropteroate synthase [Planctomycetota bacterium]
MAPHRIRIVDRRRPFEALRESGPGAGARGHRILLDGLRDAEAILLAHCAEQAGLVAVREGSAIEILGTSESFRGLPESLGQESLAALGEQILAAIGRIEQREFQVPLPQGGELDLGVRTLVMGVLNVTPDSFSDGGEFLDADKAVARGVRMAEEGADLLDVGGESTRPGADPVSPEEEMERVLPVIERLTEEVELPLSVDTRRGTVAREGLRAGAQIVNDVSGLSDPLTAAVAAHAGAPVIVMHMRGTPTDMRSNPEWTTYGDVVREVMDELELRVRRALDAGVEDSRILIDPGIGFAKTGPQSIEVIRRLGELRGFGRPIVVGPSRKSFLAEIEDVPPSERLHLTLGAVTACVANGAHIVRVHDVEPAVQAIRAFEATTGLTGPES